MLELDGDILDENAEMLELDYLQSSLWLQINFIQYGELKAKMKILKSHYQLNRDPSLLYSNNRPIKSFVNNFINKDRKGCRKYLQKSTFIRYWQY